MIHADVSSRVDLFIVNSEMKARQTVNLATYIAHRIELRQTDLIDIIIISYEMKLQNMRVKVRSIIIWALGTVPKIIINRSEVDLTQSRQD